MLSIQKFLEYRKLSDLENAPFYLNINKKDNLVILKYNQFDSDFSHSIVKECRGIILEDKTWKVVCHPFHKFFNLGEHHAYNGMNEKFNISESYIMEKVDGSIIKVFHYNGEWKIATNGTIDAKDASFGELNNVSFSDLFFDIISKEDFLELTKQFDTDLTYIFELVHPLNRIVVDYNGLKELVFIGLIKNELIGNEVCDYDIFSIEDRMVKIFNNYTIRYPKVYNFTVSDMNELIEIADSVNNSGNEFEGFVITHAVNGYVMGRVKIKSPKYINLHHISTGSSITNRLIAILLNNEIGEFESYMELLPESIRDEYAILKNKYFSLIEYLYEKGKIYRKKSEEYKTRKELALDIQKNVNPKYIFFIFKMIDNKDIKPEVMLFNCGTRKVKKLILE